MITRLTFDQISTAVHDAYEACKDIKGSQNAHYIPYLANVNSDLFGISLCLPGRPAHLCGRHRLPLRH